MKIPTETLDVLHAALTKSAARLFGKGVVPLPSIQIFGCCPLCGRDLEAIAAVDQQLNRGRCSCGAKLPDDWRRQFRDFLMARDWRAAASAFRRWVPVQDDRPSCLAGTRAELQNRFSILSMELTADEMAKARRR